MTHHLVGMAEIAEMLGVTRQRVAQLVESYDDFPAPEVELSAGRIWSRTAIETWISSHPDRGPGRPDAGERKRRFFGSSGSRPAMFQRFTDRARTGVVLAQEQARLLHHNYIGTEHLLLGLSALGEGIAYDVLVSLGVSQMDIRDGVVEMIGEGTEDPKGHIPFTPRAKKVLELALREALALNHNYIGTEHVLLALVREKDGVAWKVLEGCGLKQKSTRDATIKRLTDVGATTSVETEVHERLTKLEERLRRLEGGEED